MDKEKLKELIQYHKDKMNECESKASHKRSNFHYDIAERLDVEADNHRNMVAYYEKLLREQ